MELWLATPVIIVGMVVVGTVVVRDRRPQEPADRLGRVLAARLVVVLTVTVLVAVAKVAVGPRAAALTGVVGTLIAVVLLIELG